MLVLLVLALAWWHILGSEDGALPASSGSFLTLLGPPPLFSNCSVCSSRRSPTGRKGRNVGKQRVGRSCLGEWGARAGHKPLGAKVRGSQPGLWLSVSDSVTGFYSWQLLSVSSWSLFLELSTPGVGGGLKLNNLNLDESSQSPDSRLTSLASHQPHPWVNFSMLLRLSNQ